MNKFFILIFYFVVFLSYLFGDSYKEFDNDDSITIKIIPNILEKTLDYNEVIVLIENYTKDTLLNIPSFYFNGITEDYILYPVYYKYIPNQIFFLTKELHPTELDGFILINYSRLPKLLIIPSYSSIYIKINLLNGYIDILKNFNWYLHCWMSFAKKSFLDDFISTKGNNIKEEYKNNLISVDTLNLEGNLIDSIKNNYYLSTNDSLFYNKFLTYFNIIAFR